MVETSNGKVFGTGSRARCAWEVRGGIIPGQPLAEHTKRFVVTSETFYADNELTPEQLREKYPDGLSTFLQAQKEANDYFLSLQDPRFLNWVDVNWIWY